MSLLTLFRRVQVRKNSGSHPTLWGNVTRKGDPLPEIFGDVKRKMYKPSKKTSPLESMFKKVSFCKLTILTFVYRKRRSKKKASFILPYYGLCEELVSRVKYIIILVQIY